MSKSSAGTAPTDFPVLSVITMYSPIRLSTPWVCKPNPLLAAHRDDPEGETVGDLLPDDGAALAFMGVEYADFLDYCRREIRAALDTLPPEYAALLRLHYLEGRTLETVAPLCGFSSKQTASEAEERALRRLERGKHRRELWECLVAFDDFRVYQEAAKRDTWAKTGLSRTEAVALANS